MTKEEFRSHFQRQLELPIEYVTYIILDEDREIFKPIIYEKKDFENHILETDLDNLIYLRTRANIPAFKYV